MNLERLIDALNPIEKLYIRNGGESWHVTSGFRFMTDHVRIYKKINEERKKEKKKLLAIPLGSQHLRGNAVDILDSKQDIKAFVAAHLDLFEEAGIYFESFKKTPSWIHMQRIAPKSGNRFFEPY